MFEILALYCEKVRPNLRNQVPHGLFDYDELASSDAVQAWVKRCSWSTCPTETVSGGRGAHRRRPNYPYE
ncbi:DUF4209 domain-containing protein [Agreia bicolorata]|uniref:DUF4209 domain-containing protein n=1 Tax=Agreia bicolorata TaxID=110935 RepID=UPI001115D72E